MASLRCAACLTLLTVVVGVTPIEKVITLIEGLKKDVEDEGKEQAEAYEKIACYCKENTEQESADILKGNDKIEKLSAEIGEETQVKKNEEAENAERSSKGEALKATLDADVVNCNKDRAEYEKNEADMAKAISSLNNAIESMHSSKPADDEEALDEALGTFLQVDMGKALKESTKRSVETLLQLKSRVDPSDPEFAFHSDDIIQLMQSLLKDFRSKKSDLDDDWKLRREACKNSQESEENQIETNDEAIEKNKGDIEKVGTELAEDKEALVGTESTVTGDKTLLKEITVNCEARAKEFDEHSKQRNDEVAALSAALQILTGRVQEATKVNGRAEGETEEAASAPAAAEGETEEASAPAAAGASFLQLKSSRHRLKFLARRLSPQQRAERSLTALRNEGRRIDSLALLAFTARAQTSADWADKLKKFMDSLLDRLVKEAKAETDQKAFCDKAVGMAKKDVNNTWEKVNSINSDLVHLEAKKDELTESTEMLKKGLEDNTKSKAEATENRDAQKAGNAETVKVAKEGLAATTEALAVLHKFYGKAALLQERQEPADTAETADPAAPAAEVDVSAPMQRKQSSTGAIFGLLQGIESDFDRTIRNTEAEEEAAEREFQELVTTLKADIKGKETDLTLDNQDLKGAGFKIKEKTEDLKTNMGLLDKALQEIEELKPACIDTGMSYEERVQKRETEMQALKKSLCLLDPDQVEEECQS